MTTQAEASAFIPGLSRSPFKPAWWLHNAHLQTLYPTLFRKLEAPACVREKVALSDGDWLYLDWHLPKDWKDSGMPLTVIVHGLSGCSGSHYVMGLQKALAQRGWASVAMNCRGATGEANDLPRAYHAGAHDDLAAVMRLVAERYETVPLSLVGYSLGGAMTLNYLATMPLPAHLFAATAVSVPLDLASCAERLDQGLSQIYRKHLLDNLMRAWRRKVVKLRVVGRDVDAERVEHLLALGPFNSFRAFDDAVIAPLHGFHSADDYYARCSPLQHLDRIHCPTLIIQAADDPFLTPRCFPEASTLSPSIYLDVSPQGGHVGFVSAGEQWRDPVYFLEQRIPAFLDAQVPDSVRHAEMVKRLPPAYQSSLAKAST